MLFRAEVYTRKQLNQALENSFINKIYVPYTIIDSSLIEENDRLIIVPPVFLADCEREIADKFSKLREIGFSNVLVHTVGHIELFSELSFELYGGHRLNCTNSESILFFADNNIKDIIVSPEMTSYQINQLKSDISIGFLAYGYLPLMITRRCPIKNGKPCNKSNCSRSIKDRKNNELKIICSENTAEILNSDVLFLADKLDKFKNADFGVLKFTTEKNINEIISAYKDNCLPEFIINYTRGLYFRGLNG